MLYCVMAYEGDSYDCPQVQVIAIYADKADAERHRKLAEEAEKDSRFINPVRHTNKYHPKHLGHNEVTYYVDEAESFANVDAFLLCAQRR